MMKRIGYEMKKFEYLQIILLTVLSITASQIFSKALRMELRGKLEAMTVNQYGYRKLKIKEVIIYCKQMIFTSMEKACYLIWKNNLCLSMIFILHSQTPGSFRSP